MQSKFAFFPSHQHFSIDSFDNAFRRLVLSAFMKRFNSVADARLYLAICGIDIELTIKILLSMEKTGILDTPISEAIFAPVGCGDIANALCRLITGDEMITVKSEAQSIIELSKALQENLPQIIRIDIPGHSYVMLAYEKTSEGIWGYIYQSNVAYGMEDNTFSLAAWLMDAKSYKTNLSEHLQKLAQLMEPTVSNSVKETIYFELYCAKPIIDVKTPANIQKIISYMNENLSLKYKIRAVGAKDMLLVAERIQRIISQHPEEQQQSLDSYISKIRTELEESNESEFYPAAEHM